MSETASKQNLNSVIQVQDPTLNTETIKSLATTISLAQTSPPIQSEQHDVFQGESTNNKLPTHISNTVESNQCIEPSMAGIPPLREKDATQPPPPSTVQNLLQNIPLRSSEPSSLPTERCTAAQNTLSKLESTSPLSLSQERTSNRKESRENESKVINPNTPLPVNPPSDVPVSIPGTLSAQGQGQKPTSGNTKTLSSGLESFGPKAPTNTSPTQLPSTTYSFDNSQPTSGGYHKATPGILGNISPPKEEESKRPKKPITGVPIFERFNKYQILYFAVPILICVVISLIISILEIVFSNIYYNQCSSNPNIPIYLNFAGIVTLFTTTLSIMTALALGVTSSEVIKSDKILSIMRKILRIILIIAHVLLVIFLISLLYNVFHIFKTVQHDRMEESKTYCGKKLYRFTAIISIIHIIDTLILYFCAFRIPNKQ
ncbi:unnamed protein product [Adineta steineri]|uniref:Uncharacterized protein n=1 Tax=Adineta steineri TaxID=433720 RepID=A0A815PQR1_9BILA|nr:unnamed protein product [Adineta steineri]CAF3933513.1 unnamed protein product [Adineta steineri]